MAQKYVDLRNMTKTPTKIAKMFIEKDLFCPKFAASEQAQITWYLIMIKKDIRQLMSIWRYSNLANLQDATRKREIEIEIQMREQWQAPIQLQSVSK